MEFLNKERKLLYDVGIAITNDKTVLFDVSNFRLHDVAILIRRVEKLQNLLVKEEVSTKWISNFIETVVYCYLQCAESIKLSRAVFKLLQPWRHSSEDVIEAEFQLFLKDVFQEVSNSKQELISVSNLLENNEFGRGLFEKLATQVVLWLNQRFDGILSSNDVEEKDKDILYMYIKILMQLYQFCPLTYAHPVLDSRLGDVTISCRNLFKSLIVILSKEIIAVDCHLLCGTAVIQVITIEPDADKVINYFWNIYNVIDTDTQVQVDLLLNSGASKANGVKHTTGHLALLKGIIIKWQLFNNKTSFLLDCFKELIGFCYGPLSIHYHAFSTMEQMMSKLVKLLPLIAASDISNLTSAVIPDVTKTVFLNWDSPIQDVPQIVTKIFSLVLQIWQQAYTIDSCHDILPDLLTRLQNIAWNVKGQYRIISAMVPFVDAEKLFSSKLKTHLLMCMATNYLAAVGLDVYKSFLNKLSFNQNKLDVWDAVWKNTVVKGLTSNNRLQRYNVGHYWIPSTLKFLPGIEDTLLSSVSQLLSSNLNRSHALHGWVIVSKVMRASTGKFPSDMSLLHEALWSNDDDIRSESFSIICVSVKKADRLRNEEARLLKECLPYNLKIDSAPFRQQLVSNIKKLMIRIRDSYRAMVKDKDIQSIERSIDFIDWFYKLSVDNLIIDCSFQRTKTCLEFLQVMLEIFLPSDTGYPDITVEGKQQELWNQYNAIEPVLHCLLDGADEVQNIARRLLLHHFSWPVVPLNCSAEDYASHLLMSALELCNRPKQHENRSGILLCNIIFIKYVVDLHWHFEWSYKDGSFIVVSIEKDVKSSCEQFLSAMFSHIYSTFQQAKTDPVKSSSSSPLQGFLGALTVCLKEAPDVYKSDDESLCFLLKFIDLNCNIIDEVMDIMAKDALDGDCPSFAELGMAMESWITETDTGYSETSHISSQHQFLLSWCWINIKECCNSLCSLCGMLLRLDTMTDRITVIKQIQRTFLSVLYRCRHRGVIEGCRSSFIQFIDHAYSSGEKGINLVPRQILEEAFERLKCQASTTSVTRRSAGIPIVIQAIVSVERKHKQDSLLQYTINNLFELSSIGLPSHYNDQHDLPQVHGLNILNTLFGDASLSVPLMAHISKAVILVMNSFDSPAWSVRNAATMLFSSLVMRIFGQKKNCMDEEFRGISLLEFSALYPELPAVMNSCLQTALQEDVKRIDRIKTSVFPVLTLLAYLRPTDVLSDQDHIGLEQNVFMFLSSHVFHLRNQAATAYVAFVPIRSLKDTIQTIDTQIQHAATNQLHGLLTFLHKLTLQELGSENTSAIKSLLIKNKRWFNSPCGMVRAKLYQLLKLLCKDSPEDLAWVADMIQQNLKYQHFNVAEFMALDEEIEINLKSLLLNGSEINILLEKYLNESNTMISESFVKCISNNLLYMKDEDLHVVQLAFSKYLLSGSKHYPLISEILQVVIDIHRRVSSDVQVINNFEEFLRKNGRLSADNSITLKIMTVRAICIQHVASSKRLDVYMVEQWTQEVYNASKRVGDEHCTAAYCLKAAGPNIIDLGKSREDLQPSIVLLIRSALVLMEDEDPEVRNTALDFIVSLQWNSKQLKYESIVFTKGSEMLLDFLCDQLWNSSHIVKELHQTLYNPGTVQQLYQTRVLNRRLQLFEKEDNSCFSEKFLNQCQIFRSLMIIYQKYRDNMKVFPELHQDCVMSDVDFIRSTILTKSGVFAVMSDGLVLEVIGGLLLAAYFLTVIIGDQEKAQQLMSLIQSGPFPVSFRNRLVSSIKD